MVGEAEKVVGMVAPVNLLADQEHSISKSSFSFYCVDTRDTGRGWGSGGWGRGSELKAEQESQQVQSDHTGVGLLPFA